jgi:GTP cyclohydrolase I
MHGVLNDHDHLILTVQVPISAPLPTQQAEGLPRSLGHWGVAEISLRFTRFIWIEDFIEMAEEVIALHLDRPIASSGPRDLSVEKIAKALGRKFAGHPDISWFAVTVENLAAGFNTFASLEWPEPTVH